MGNITDFLSALNTNIFSKPEFILATFVFLGALLMKKKVYDALASSIKTIVGYYILTIGSNGLTNTFKPIINGLNMKFGVDAVMLDTYFTGAAVYNETNGIGTMGGALAWALLVWGVAVAVNILLVTFSKISKCRTFYIRSGFNTAVLYLWLFFAIMPVELRTFPIALLVGVCIGVKVAVFSNLTVEASQRLTDKAGLAVGHNQMLGVWLADKLGRFFAKNDETKTEEKELPGWLTIFNDNTVSTAIVMTLFFGTMLLFIGKETMMQNDTSMKAAEWFGSYILNTCLNFSVYLNILLMGVRMFAGEVTRCFKGITDKFMKGAILAVDCAVMFGFTESSTIMTGFIAGFLGQMTAVLGLILLKSPILVATGFIPMFFDNATIGIFAHKAGGKKAEIILCYLSGMIQVLGGLVVVMMFRSAGFQMTSYLGTFDSATLMLGQFGLVKLLGTAGLVISIIIMLIIPQIQYIRNKEGYFEGVGE